jgi:hypothetical protein
MFMNSASVLPENRTTAEVGEKVAEKPTFH